jgi:hypothetical protein
MLLVQSQKKPKSNNLLEIQLPAVAKAESMIESDCYSEGILICSIVILTY